MTSKIIVNNLESDAGINTITINSDVTINQIGIGTDNPDHSIHTYGNIGIGKSEVDGYEIVLTNNNINFSRDAKSFINQLGTGTIVVRMGSSNTEVAEFTSDGLKLPSGKGIDFSATSDASGMGSELLDDYEEGSWTPTISGNTLDTSAGHSEYTKIGHRVFFQTHFNLGSNPGDTFTIGGLPFTSSSTSRSAISIVVNDNGNSYAQVSGQTATVGESGTTIACDIHGTITLGNDDRINLGGSYLV